MSSSTDFGGIVPDKSNEPKIHNIFDFTAEALEQLAFWLEQRGLTTPISQLVGFSRFQQRCILARSVGQSVASGAYTPLTWDTETADTGGFHSTTSNTNRITIPTEGDGEYLVGASVVTTYAAFPAGAVGVLILTKNTELSGAYVSTGVQSDDSGLVFTGASNSYSLVVPLKLVAGDYLSLSFFHNTGVNATIPNVTNFPASGFWLARVA